MTRTSITALVAGLGLALAPALAQAHCHNGIPEGTVAADHAASNQVQPTAGDADEDPAVLADDDESPDEGTELQVEDSAILPSAEGHLESEAPTMEIDCAEDPQHCAGEPLQTASEGPALSEGEDEGNGEVNTAGEPVVAEPQC